MASTSNKPSIAIIGAGPAGSYAAFLLSRAGYDVRLFHWPRFAEKPCGGGVTGKALAEFPILRDANLPRIEVQRVEFVGPDGSKVELPAGASLQVFTRSELDAYLRSRAVASGASVVEAKVTGLVYSKTGWEIRADNLTYRCDFLVGADGVTSLVRKTLSRPFSRSDFIICAGRRVYGSPEPVMKNRFFDDLNGYGWIFPRKDHLSAGIGLYSGRFESGVMQQRLSQVLLSSSPGSYADGESFTAVIPAVCHLSARDICGRNWALIGDAAGLADPITGEGIYYALKSAALLAEAVQAGETNSYGRLCQQQVFPELAIAASLRRGFFSPRFLNMMVRLLSSSGEVRQLFADVVTGTVSYTTLKARIQSSLFGGMKVLLQTFRHAAQDAAAIK